MYFGKKVVIVMPAYNAAKTVTQTVDAPEVVSCVGRTKVAERPGEVARHGVSETIERE